MIYAVSACLMGDNCKYSGGNNRCDQLIRALKDHEVVRVCPEVSGGLPTPRIPVELQNGVAINKSGVNVHKNFMAGAELCLQKVKAKKVDAVILQERSPSCGKGQIYDGTFSGKLVEGNGLFTELLLKEGVEVFTVEEFLNR